MSKATACHATSSNGWSEIRDAKTINNIEINNDLKEQSKAYFLEAFFGVLMNYEISNTWDIGVGYNYQTALSDLYKTDEYNLRTNSFNLQINYRIK